jgi:hypothetical protein
MRQAVSAEAAGEALEPEDFLFFADALFAFGGLSAEKEACHNVSVGIQRGAQPAMVTWSAFIDCSIKRSDLKPLALAMSGITNVDLIALVFDRLGKLLVGTAGYTFANEWASALSRILTSQHFDEERKAYYLDLVSENRTLTARIKHGS